MNEGAKKYKKYLLDSTAYQVLQASYLGNNKRGDRRGHFSIVMSCHVVRPEAGRCCSAQVSGIGRERFPEIQKQGRMPHLLQ